MAPSCANITLEKIRAEIDFGGTLIFSTPDILSFNVSRSRGQLAATFSASIEVPATTVFPVSSDIVIRAGTEGNLQTIFTGRVLSITVNPSFDNALIYVVNLSGSDIFQQLESRTFSRRQRTRGQSTFASITGIQSKAPQKGISVEKRIGAGGVHRITSADTNIREHSKLVKTDRTAWDPFSVAKEPESVTAEDATAATTDVVDIKPRSIALAPGISVQFNIEGTTYEEGDSWGVSDTTIGTISDKQDGTAVYTQNALGENTITFTKASAGSGTFIGKAVAVGIPIHDHSSLSQAGPSHGVFGSE